MLWYEEKTRNFKYFSILPQWWVKNEKQLQSLINQFILTQKYEGLVVKNTNAIYKEGQSIDWIKIKSKNREKIKFKLNKYGIWL